jgi:triosephosphate isomerase
VAALSAGLVVLLCVGETLAQRESGATFSVIEAQVRDGLGSLLPESLSNVVIAYEPVWAIGTGKTASDDQAQEVHAFIRMLVAQLYSASCADMLRILYGGSVKPENIKGLMSQPDIDGALVGGASLKPESFAGIVRFSS